jgi:CRISPR-associated protein Csm2
MATQIDEILGKLKGIRQMADLKPRDFSEEGGDADILAQNFHDLNPTQLRKVFGALKQVEIQNKAEPNDKLVDRSVINRLIPELAYARGRGLVPEEFYDLMKTCLSQTKMKTFGDLRRVIEFLTALLAYQKLRTRRR